MITYFVCLLFWILFSVCCVAVGKNRKNNSLNSPFTIFGGAAIPPMMIEKVMIQVKARGG